MSKKLLLVSPRISDIYKDIICQLQQMDIEADYIEDVVENGDTFYIRGKNYSKKDCDGNALVNSGKAKKWKQILESTIYNKIYDYLLVVDGMSVHPFLFEELKRRNPSIWMVNYLFDSTYSLYEFQHYFKYYNKVFSFDKKDCSKYQLVFLPIYWKQIETNQTKGFDLFGFGGYSKTRLNLYKQIGRLSETLHLNSYLKVYVRPINNMFLYSIKYLIKRILRKTTHISPCDYYDTNVSHTPIPLDEFQSLTNSSSIIVDTVNFEQDGMTARFMWALGMGKKIITNNINIRSYDCYTKEQVYVIDDVEIIDWQELTYFIKNPYTQPEYIVNILKKWRLDNWIKILLYV